MRRSPPAAPLVGVRGAGSERDHVDVAGLPQQRGQVGRQAGEDTEVAFDGPHGDRRSAHELGGERADVGPVDLVGGRELQLAVGGIGTGLQLEDEPSGTRVVVDQHGVEHPPDVLRVDGLAAEDRGRTGRCTGPVERSDQSGEHALEPSGRVVASTTVGATGEGFDAFGIGIREEDEILDLQSSDVDQGRSLLRRRIGAVLGGGVVHRSVDRFAPVSCAAPRCPAPPRPAVSAGATRGGRTH